MEKETGLLKDIRSRYESFSRGKKKLADFVLNDLEQAAFLTAAKLGEAVNVSEATVLRFALDLGFDGYPQFQSKLQELIRQRIHPLARMEEVYGEFEQPELLAHVLQSDMESLAAARQTVDGRAFSQAVDLLDKARKIYLVGLRSCAPLAQVLHMNLKLVREDVVLLQSSSEHELLEQMIDLTSEDAVVGISFPRYSLRTIKMLEFANSRQASVITLTDSSHSPLNLYSSCNLTIPCDMSSAAPSLTAAMSVVNALFTALCMKHKEQVISRLRSIEQVLSEFQIFGGDELDQMEEYVELRPFHYPEEP